MEGEKYKRIIDKDKPEDIQNWYQRKNMYLVCNRKIDDSLYSSKLVDDLKSGFNLIAPLYRYFQRIKLESYNNSLSQPI